MAGLLMVFILMIAMTQIAMRRSHDDIRRLLTEKAAELNAWTESVRQLCRDEELRELEVSIDCETGAIELPNKILFEFNSDEIRPAGRDLLRIAVPRILDRLAAGEGRFWERLEKVEVRGHSDPKALRDDPYGRNLRVSQSRAYSVLTFLTTDSQVPPRHRENLQSKGVAAGASDSRRPKKCDEPGISQSTCFEAWRRVEIHLDFRDNDFRAELNEIFMRVLDMVGTDV
ncbi:MAG: OmpA family protein [Spirochaetaceae bacterium]|nr:OmpA family protein [Spirochaetaceae bacterium]